MYKLIELPLIHGQRAHTIGKVNLDLKVNDIFVYGYKDKETKQLEVNKYKVVDINQEKQIYKVVCWVVGSFFGVEWAIEYKNPVVMTDNEN